MKRANFDRVCKNLLIDLASNMGFKAFPQFCTDPQKQIETSLGYAGKTKSRRDSIDVAWKSALTPYGMSGLAKSLFQDIAVAWEVDASNSSKVVKSSIQNLDRLNPRLGIELLLVGGSLKAIENFDNRFETALTEARGKKTRICVLHDIHFAIVYYDVRNRHPKALYEVYIAKCNEEPEIAIPLKHKLVELLNRSNKKEDFKNEIQREFIDKLGHS